MKITFVRWLLSESILYCEAEQCCLSKRSSSAHWCRAADIWESWYGVADHRKAEAYLTIILLPCTFYDVNKTLSSLSCYSLSTVIKTSTFILGQDLHGPDWKRLFMVPSQSSQEFVATPPSIAPPDAPIQRRARPQASILQGLLSYRRMVCHPMLHRRPKIQANPPGIREGTDLLNPDLNLV